MVERSLTPEEISELTRYGVWLCRISKSLNAMLDMIHALPMASEEASKYTVQERNKMLRLAFEDLRIELGNVEHELRSLHEEYARIQQE